MLYGVVEDGEQLLKVVAHPDRLQIMNILLNGENQVSEIQMTTGINDFIIFKPFKDKFSKVLKPNVSSRLSH